MITLAIAAADADFEQILALQRRYSHQALSGLPKLEPMFVQFEQCRYRGRPLSTYRFFVGGQVCVDRAFRGQGLAASLYQQVRRSLLESYDLCVTEIATRNRFSLKSHEKMGFRPLLNYSDAAEQWTVVAWDLSAAG